jgi:hypothetical protein
MSTLPPNNTTFNRSNHYGVSVGYYSRTLFTFAHLTGNLDGTTIEGSGGDGIQYLIDTYPDYCHGSHSLPANYWLGGKSIRIKGSFLAMGAPEEEIGANTTLNLGFGIKETTTPTTYMLAYPDPQSRMDLELDGTPYCPVDFECTMTLTHPNTGSLSVWWTSGYFGWEKDNYNDTGENKAPRYTPVWLKNPYATGISTDYVTQPTKIIFNFYDSTVPYLFLRLLTIEELA